MKKLKSLSLKAAIWLLQKLDNLSMYIALRINTILSYPLSSLRAHLESAQSAQLETLDSVSSAQNWHYYTVYNPSGFFETRTTQLNTPAKSSPRKSVGGTGTAKPRASTKSGKQKSKKPLKKSKKRAKL